MLGDKKVRQKVPIDRSETHRREYLRMKGKNEGETRGSTANHGRRCTELGDREPLSMMCAGLADRQTTGIRNPGTEKKRAAEEALKRQRALETD